MISCSYVQMRLPEDHDQKRDEYDDGKDHVNDEWPLACLYDVRLVDGFFDRRAASKANQRLVGDLGATRTTFHRPASMTQSRL
jgi:hypothetical protein